MAVIQQDGFDFFDDLKEEPDFLIITTDRLQAQIDYIKSKQIKSIALADFATGDIQNLDFLEEIPFIERVMINSMDIDFSGLYYLKDLKFAILSILNKKQHLDFSKFVQLEFLSTGWYTQFPSLAKNKKLKELNLRKYKPKEKNFTALSLPDCIENIEIVQSNVLNFKGLSLPNLKKIEAHYCRNLNSLEGVEHVTATLESLIICYCGKFTDYDRLPICVHLEKIILGHCGDMPNLKWVPQLKKVKHLSFYGTRVLDGDISPCFGIAYVGFKDARHYNHKMKDFTDFVWLQLK